MSKKSEIIVFIGKKIKKLYASSESSETTATLASMRKGVGKTPGEVPEVLSILLAEMPENFLSTNGIPTKEEWACYIALTLFAWHQQGHSITSEKMHTDENVSIGAALKNLALTSEDDNAASRELKRLKNIVSSNTIEEMSYHLRSIIRLFNSKNIRLNYCNLAADLYEWQFNENRNSLSLKWAQDFYRVNNKEDKNNA